MSDFEIRVVGAEPPRKPEKPITRHLLRVGRVCKAVLKRPRAVVFTGLAVFVLFVGTPHVGWDYECRVPMRPGKPCPSLSYCAYYGIQGRRVMFPEDDDYCRLVTVLPIAWDRIL